LHSNLSTARLRWAAVRKNHVDPAHNEEDCRSYATNVIDQVRILELIDSEIDAFNDLIGTLCSR
jgi:hypothetical protein